VDGRRALGDHGERLVASWYEARGFTVLARNWRVREGELDVVVGRDGLVVVCEVKTRSSGRFGSPLEAVTPRKQRRLRHLAAAWLAATGRPASTVRFDVAAVHGGTRVEVVEDAF
jgi:putative endonuclease